MDRAAVDKKLSDERLMMAYSQGDASAFEELLRRHQRPVLNFVFRFVGNRATAEDLVQDVFLRIIRRAKSYKREAKFTTWLYTIARNICIDHSRRMQHRRTASLDHPVRSDGENRRTLGESLPSPDAATDRRAMGRQLGEQIKAAVDSLAEDQREVFLMREYLGLPFKEIADIIGIPENTAKSRMRYALEKLRADLSEYEDMARQIG
ncbi:MAG: RNA polymerase sigma factor [bacterium]